MRFIRVICLLLFLCCVSTVAQAQKKLQDAAAATGNGSDLTISYSQPVNGIIVQVSGTFVGTITFRATLDGTNWIDVEGVSLADSTAKATTATAPGLYSFACPRVVKFRAAVTAYTSGSITVTASAAIGVAKSYGGGGGGSGDITAVVAGAGISGGASSGSATVTWDPSTFVNNVTLWDSSQASRTITFGLSGATDPVLTVGNNSVDVTTGVLKYGGNTVATLAGTEALTSKTINKVTITTPATGATLTIPDGVTLNAGAGGTLGSNAFNSTAFIAGSTGATDKAILRANGTGGATAQNSLVTISDIGRIVANITNTGSGLSGGIDVELTANSASNTSGSKALKAGVLTSGTVNYTSNTVALDLNAEVESTGTIGNLYSTNAFTYNGSSPTVTLLGGAIFSLQSDTGAVATARGFYTDLTVNGGTITNRYGVRVANPDISGGGLVTNNYGVYVDSQTSGGTLNYSFFAAGGLAHFGGNTESTIFDATTGFRIGGAAASRKMIVGNGANFVPSAETWAVPGTSGNVLTSDGTNWTSAAPAGGGTTINSSDSVIPYRSNSTTFANSPITVSTPGSMVDGLTVTGAATANPATVGIAATGSDTNIRIGFTSKGAGNFVFANGGLLAPDFGAESGTLAYGFTSSPTTGIWFQDGTGINVRVSGTDRFTITATGADVNGPFTATTTTLSGNLIVNGSTSVIRLKGYTVATLPAGTQGDTAFVTDALAPTFLATIVGGGTVVTPVFFNGANWVGY